MNIQWMLIVVSISIHFMSIFAQPANKYGEKRDPQFAAHFTKLLEHDPKTGLLSPKGLINYKKLLHALETRTDFNSVERTKDANRLWANPQLAYTPSLGARPSKCFKLPKPPDISSAEAACDMIEVYLQALCRNIDFNDYGTGRFNDSDGKGGSITKRFANYLESFGSLYKGPRDKSGKVTPQVLFRGKAVGDLKGPYISQFLLQPLSSLIPAGDVPFINDLLDITKLSNNKLAIQQLLPKRNTREFGITWRDFVDIQNGFIPRHFIPTDFDFTKLTYIANGRDLGMLVYFDGIYHVYCNAITMLVHRKIPHAHIFPYNDGTIKNEFGAGTMGIVDAYTLVGAVYLEALKATWFHKWISYKRLRPEAMAGLIHQAKTNRTNFAHLHRSLFECRNGIDILETVKKHNQKQVGYYPKASLNVVGTYLLGQLYPEGSPAHPSYPSGHATAAGACSTVIKALFNDQTPINYGRFNPVKVDPKNKSKLILLTKDESKGMTIGTELDKLASNMPFGRNFAGIHFRSDADQGLALGEQVAISYLQKHAQTYPEKDFKGYEFTKRDGTRIRVTASRIIVIK